MPIKLFGSGFKLRQTKILILAALSLIILSVSLIYSSKQTLLRVSSQVKLDRCSQIDSGSVRAKCFADLILPVIDSGKIREGFDMISSVSQSKTAGFDSVCHSLTHSLGGAAYKLFKNHKDFDLGPNASYCGYGFFHGMAEALINSGDDPSQAKDLCGYINRKIGQQLSAVMEDCFHGIGHGAGNIHDRGYYGDAAGIINQALAICRKVTSEENTYKTCYSGSIMSVSQSSVRQEYGLSVNRDDPFWFCRTQPNDIKTECFNSFFHVINFLANSNLSQAMQLAQDKISDPAIVSRLIRTLSGATSNLGGLTESELVQARSACSKLAVRYQSDCFWGFSQSVMQAAIPGRLDIALQFCNFSDPDVTNLDSCFKGIVFGINQYFHDQARSMCPRIDTKYRQHCGDNPV